MNILQIIKYLKKNMVKFNIPFKTKLKTFTKTDFIKKCESFLEEKYNEKVLLTNSATSALEMIANLANINKGDEIITTSYTLSSTVLPFINKGAKIKFVDIDKETMCIDASLIEKAITDKTKAVIVMYYAGIACDIELVVKLCKKHNLKLIEDAAQAIFTKHNKKMLGTFGDYGCISFQDAKTFTMGEGGALIIKNTDEFEYATILREKGTNRYDLLNGKINKYFWVGNGSSYMPANINAQYLYKQFLIKNKIIAKRTKMFYRYYKELKGIIDVQKYIGSCNTFYIITRSAQEREELIKYLKVHGIMSAIHFVPLHSSTGGKLFKTEFIGNDIYTTDYSERLLRLPLHNYLTFFEQYKIINTVKEFFRDKK